MTVLVTGGSQNIGAEISKAFARAGYDVAINCYNQQALENGGVQTAEECRTHGVKAECFIADVSDYSACEAMVKDVLDQFGQIDVLVNNAGITKDGLILRMKEEDFDTVINTNLKSVFNMIRLCTPSMVKKRKGNIINMSSVAGVYGNAGQINYSASKAGIVGITKTTAKELGKRGIICNAIAPGFIETPMTAKIPEDLQKKMLESITLGRYGKPSDVAETALFLATQSYITGQVLVVDGGLF